MHMVGLDWIVIGIYFLVTIGVGLSFSHRAGKGVEDFFLAGRKLTWWLAGGSMVATMFASDTPLFHTGNVRDLGLSAGWLFFLPMFGALAAAAVFARLVRRTRVVTDAEFIELRYSGSAPAPFRGFMAAYSGLFVASLTMGWVTKGMVTVTSQMLGWREIESTVIVLAVVAVYSAASGMWGVVMTDMFQYIVAAVGSVFLAVAAVHACGGFEGLRHGLAAIPGYSGSDLHFIPTAREVPFTPGSTSSIPMTFWLLIAWFIVYSIGQASSGAHQGQRVLACRTEKDASLTFVFYSICYYALNGMSWVITGLASVIILGATNQQAHLADSGRTFPAMINALMPAGLRGLMLASIFAAFMSTVSVLLNWGSSYVVNDLYSRFMVRNASQKHYVWVARIASLGIAILGGTISLRFQTLSDIFAVVPPLLTGAVVVYIARYLWWRTNIWSEISAMVAAPIIGFYVGFVVGADKFPIASGLITSVARHLPYYGAWHSDTSAWLFFGQKLLTTVGLTTVVWIVVTLLTKPTDMEKLRSFYMLVRPTGPGWWYVQRKMENPPPVESAVLQFGVWLASILFVLGAIVSVVCLIQGRTVWCIVWAIAAITGAVLLNKGLNLLDRNAVAHEEAVKAMAEAPAAGN